MKPIHKLNNGLGATLCHECTVIISIGLTKDLYCNNCLTKKKKMMTKEKVKQTLPKWFDGTVYPEGGEVTNPYSGCSCYLNGKELSMYDFIKGSEMLLESGKKNEYLVNKFYEGLWWFKDNNIKAYMILLD